MPTSHRRLPQRAQKVTLDRRREKKPVWGWMILQLREWKAQVELRLTRLERRNTIRSTGGVRVAERMSLLEDRAEMAQKRLCYLEGHADVYSNRLNTAITASAEMSRRVSFLEDALTTVAAMLAAETHTINTTTSSISEPACDTTATTSFEVENAGSQEETMQSHQKSSVRWPKTLPPLKKLPVVAVRSKSKKYKSKMITAPPATPSPTPNISSTAFVQPPPQPPVHHPSEQSISSKQSTPIVNPLMPPLPQDKVFKCHKEATAQAEESSVATPREDEEGKKKNTKKKSSSKRTFEGTVKCDKPGDSIINDPSPFSDNALQREIEDFLKTRPLSTSSSSDITSPSKNLKNNDMNDALLHNLSVGIKSTICGVDSKTLNTIPESSQDKNSSNGMATCSNMNRTYSSRKTQTNSKLFQRFENTFTISDAVVQDETQHEITFTKKSTARNTISESDVSIAENVDNDFQLIPTTSNNEAGKEDDTLSLDSSNMLLRCVKETNDFEIVESVEGKHKPGRRVSFQEQEGEYEIDNEITSEMDEPTYVIPNKVEKRVSKGFKKQSRKRRIVRLQGKPTIRSGKKRKRKVSPDPRESRERRIREAETECVEEMNVGPSTSHLMSSSTQHQTSYSTQQQTSCSTQQQTSCSTQQQTSCSTTQQASFSSQEQMTSSTQQQTSSSTEQQTSFSSQEQLPPSIQQGTSSIQQQTSSSTQQQASHSEPQRKTMERLYATKPSESSNRSTDAKIIEASKDTDVPSLPRDQSVMTDVQAVTMVEIMNRGSPHPPGRHTPVKRAASAAVRRWSAQCKDKQLDSKGNVSGEQSDWQTGSSGSLESEPNQDRDSRGDPPLVQAIRTAGTRGGADAVAALLAEGARVDARGHNMRTALHTAAARGNKKATKLLLQAGASIEATDAHGARPLTLAVAKGHWDVVSQLLSAGADPNVCDQHGVPVVSVASERQDEAILRLLLEEGANPNNVGSKSDSKKGKRRGKKKGNTALALAVGHQNIPIVELLLQHGALPNIQNSKCETPLFTAVSLQNLDLVNILLTSGASPFIMNRKGDTILGAAVKTGNIPILVTLLNHEVPDEKSIEPASEVLWTALLGGNVEVLWRLLSAAPRSVRGDFGSKALRYSVERDQATLLKILLRAGADIDTIYDDDWKSTLLHVSAMMGHVDCVSVLLDESFDVDKEDDRGRTALSVALDNYQIATVKVLVRAGARISDDLVRRAVATRQNKALQIFLDAGADCNIADKYEYIDSWTENSSFVATGGTLLTHAVSQNDQKSVEVLLQAGAEVNVRDSQGYSPLHYAVKEDNCHILRLLLKAGADSRTPVAQTGTATKDRNKIAKELARTDEVKEVLESFSRE